MGRTDGTCWAAEVLGIFPQQGLSKNRKCTMMYMDLHHHQDEYKFMAISSGLSDAQIFPSHGMGQA